MTANEQPRDYLRSGTEAIMRDAVALRIALRHEWVCGPYYRAGFYPAGENADVVGVQVHKSWIEAAATIDDLGDGGAVCGASLFDAVLLLLGEDESSELLGYVSGIAQDRRDAALGAEVRAMIAEEDAVRRGQNHGCGYPSGWPCSRCEKIDLEIVARIRAEIAKEGT